MKVDKKFWQRTATILLGLTFCALALYYGYLLVKEGNQNDSQSYIEKKFGREAKTFQSFQPSLVDPSQAPEPIRSAARHGFEIMVETQTHAADYVGNKLQCTNCHFAGGDTTGGAQGGISLVGVAAKYPDYDARDKKIIDLPERINGCFLRSMNGKPLPLDSELMLALVTYLHWISQEQPIYGELPFLGLKPLKKIKSGEPAEGKRTYDVYCALCHRDDGQGGKETPPLWGDGSFNSGAGFNNEITLATFIYWNMPYFDATPVLSEEQAFDVAAYILSHPRPKYTLHE